GGDRSRRVRGVRSPRRDAQHRRPRRIGAHLPRFRPRHRASSTRMNLVVLIPCKNLDRGKSRLAACLSPRSRRALCEFFLCRTLDVATQALAPARVRVVASAPGVAAIAPEYGAGAIPDGDAVLNAALARGRARALAEAGDCA